MGATWVLTREHIPILIPPLGYSDVKGVIPSTQGFKLNDAMQLNMFKEKIESVFKLTTTLNQSLWERKRDRIVGRVDKAIRNQQSMQGPS